MDKREQQSIGSGFFLGLLFGLAIALLFTTKKGRKILRILLDEGLEKFEEWQDIVKDTTRSQPDTQEEDDVEGGDYIAREVVMPVQPEKETKQEKHSAREETKHEETRASTIEDHEEPTVVKRVIDALPQEHEDNEVNVKPKSTVRRFFRGVRRKSS